MDPSDVFVFAGAGVSRSMPSNLPVFLKIRDAVLGDLALNQYIAGDPAADGARVDVAAGLLPEPFMLALADAGVPVEQWLEQVLGGGRPNAAHRALSQLVEDGARVWTVNFDHLIEDAGRALIVSAWPDAPSAVGQLMKPHGTLGGGLMVTARQVLGELDPPWLNRLKADVAGRTALFVGYSGNDLDFRPIWDEVLATASQVVWFDMDDPVSQAGKRLLLPRVESAGRLKFSPSAAPGGWDQNPSFDFVSFCVDQGLIDMDDAEMVGLFDGPASFIWPPLPDGGPEAVAAVRETLGDVTGARSILMGQALNGPRRSGAVHNLLDLTINHGGRPSAAALAVAATLTPPVSRGTALRAVAHRKRVTILANRGRHRAVMRATRRPPADGASTELILRSASERFVESLDAAEATGTRALRLSLAEGHNARVAHAAFQRAMSLLWAERLPEARECLESELQPYASLAANRWVAWSDYISAALLVRSPACDVREALRRLSLSRARFAAEALVDGTVSADTAQLTVRRRALALDGFVDDAEQLKRVISGRQRRMWFYTRGHPFAMEAVDLEIAEYERVHGRGAAPARSGFHRVASSRYPLHRCLGLLGLALVAPSREEQLNLARRAVGIADPFGARLVVLRGRDLIDGAANSDRELFFC